MKTKKTALIAAAAVGGILLLKNKKKVGLGAPAKSGKKKKSRKKTTVKDSTCRTYGNWMSTHSDEKYRKKGAAKLSSKTCKTKAQIKKGTSKVAAISKRANKIRKPGEAWQSAMKRAAKEV